MCLYGNKPSVLFCITYVTYMLLYNAIAMYVQSETCVSTINKRTVPPLRPHDTAMDSL